MTHDTGLGSNEHLVVLRAGGSSALLHTLSRLSQDVFAIVSLRSAIYEHNVLIL